MPDDPPPPHMLSIKRLHMLTTAGAPAGQVENQLAGMMLAWTTELAEDRSAFRDRLNELEEGLVDQLEALEGQLGDLTGGAKQPAERQAVALRAALEAVRTTQERLGT